MQTARTLARPAGTAALALTLLATTLQVARADDYEVRRDTRSTRPHSAADGNLVDVQIRVAGKNTPLYFRPGAFDRHYFEAMRGRNYSLMLRNNSGQRIGVLVAVDGLNVVNGERTNLSRNEAMYVLGPYEEADIRGWRTSLDEVRRFVFVDEERSYAERTGQANGDLGWIRVLSFRENDPVSWFRGKEIIGRNGRSNRDEAGLDSRLDADDAPRAQAEKSGERSEARARGESSMAPMAPDANPGTGWGQRSHDRVERTDFRAAGRHTDHLVLRYEYGAGLRALGIFPQRNRLWDRESGHLGFAKPPKW